MEAELQVVFHGDGSILNNTALLSNTKSLNCSPFQMKYFHSLPVNNVYFQIHFFSISQQIKLSLPSVEKSVSILYLFQETRSLKF